MRLFHLADLHIGKRLNGCSLAEDQAHMLEEILRLVRAQKPQVVMIAGDVYDRTVPSPEAVSLLDGFLTELVRAKVTVLIIAGNHDSGERLAFGARILQAQGVHLCGLYRGQVQRVLLEDAHGPVAFHLLPYVHPAQVREFLPDAEIHNHDQATQGILAANPLEPGLRHVLLAHQFFVGSAQGPLETEIGAVGGLESVEARWVAGFDYAALGHLHGPRQMGLPHVRYGGSPLKYSFGECQDEKSITQVDLGAKGQLRVEPLFFTPLRDLRKIRGPLERLISPEIAAQGNCQDYLHVTLTDEETPVDAMDKLRTVYPHVMDLEMDNARSRANLSAEEMETEKQATPYALFEGFFAEQNGGPMSDSQAALVQALLSRLEGSE